MPRFHFIKQLDSMQCGVACLAMVCRYYGKEYSLKALSHWCRPTSEGVSLHGISEAAGKVGMRTIYGRVSMEQLVHAPLPCILHWRQNHFTVLYRIGNKGRKYYVADPAKGLLTYSPEEFRTGWISTASGGEECGVALILQTTPAFFETRPPQSESSKTSFTFLAGYAGPYRRYFMQIGLGLFAGCVIQLIFPFLTQSIVDIGITHKNIHFIWLILTGQLVLTFSRTAIDFIRRWLLLHISMRINISLLSDFFIKLFRLPMSFFDTRLMGDLLQRMNDHSRVERFLTTQTLSVMFSLLSFLILGIVLLIYDKLIFTVFLIGSAVYALWIMFFLRRRKVLDYELFEKQAASSSCTYQMITSMQEIKLQDCSQRRRWEWEDTLADVFGVQMKSLKLQQTQDAGGIFINEIKNIVITVLSATAVINGNMTLGMMLAVQYIIGQLNSPVEQLMSFIYSVQDVRISLERIGEVHNSHEEEETGHDIAEFRGGRHDIILSDVCFKYDIHALRNTVENISFTIPEGKVTAVVGASGSGKTTLIKLILGYYPVSEGNISVGGIDINDINLQWWRRQCGAVMQDGIIFSESIARNIAVDDGEIDKERLVSAARIANIQDYILNLPLKYNTHIGRDGIGLSQGQKQRLLIARAIYKNPQFIFLDEATNSLDAGNEKVIVENLSEFYNGRTVVVVAHRLSTVRNADQIIVLDGGHVVEIGNHTSLIADKGIYYNLVKNQLELGN